MHMRRRCDVLTSQHNGNMQVFHLQHYVRSHTLLLAKFGILQRPSFPCNVLCFQDIAAHKFQVKGKMANAQVLVVACNLGANLMKQCY